MDRIDAKRIQVLNALEAVHDGRGVGQLLVEQVMTTDVSCVSPQSTVVDLVRLFHAKAFRHLLITDDAGQLLGVISDRDVLRCLGPGSVPSESVEQILARDLMSTDLVTTSSSTPLARAIDMLIDQGISCLPVVDDVQLVGILTNTDLHVVLHTLLQTVRLTGSENPVAATARQTV